MYHHRRCYKWFPPATIHSRARVIMLRYTRCNIVILMAATAWLILSFGSCIVCGFGSCTVFLKCPEKNLLWGHLKSTVYESYPRTIQNWRTTSATKLYPPKSLCYIRYTSTWLQHNCWLTVQTLYALYAMYILMPERISQGHVQNGRRATFSWPTLYKQTYEIKHPNFVMNNV